MPRFAVHVDDPAMLGPHDFRMWSAWETELPVRRGAARLALLTDRGLGCGVLVRISNALNSRLVSAVAEYCTTVRR